MKPILAIILLSSVISNTDAGMGELTEELLAEGLVSLDRNGVPTAFCMFSTKYGAARVQSCPVTAGFGARSVGCFTVWNGTRVLQQGCYSTQEIAMRSQCKKRVCTGKRALSGIAFCCCYGHGCNAV
ncbi:hypothetical protein PRIPAC_96875 [Pristionchus pacificus]|uniref:Activin_recp domain-containing protein n=1 Tax=Pristionchus pacificus TaxID=54126 RepID=A0A2A6D2N4_PRIPA|nr:hypothetical protein PRIPAC_96875 [Pristionchus pacificus]|eukprot:PDM84650.1 hypothetical protein PRIPAC_33673 [Pristionchus pacificus]